MIDTDEPYGQDERETHRLDISAFPIDPATQWGWTTSLDHFEDDAVWGDVPELHWQPLTDPITGETRDLAFVITPEPGSLALLALGAAVLLRRR